MPRPNNVLFRIGNTQITKISKPKPRKTRSVITCNCTVCGTPTERPNIASTKSIQILRDLIKSTIPEFNESTNDLEVCPPCNSKVLDYHRICLEVQQAKSNLVHDIRESMRQKEISGTKKSARRSTTITKKTYPVRLSMTESREMGKGQERGHRIYENHIEKEPLQRSSPIKPVVNHNHVNNNRVPIEKTWTDNETDVFKAPFQVKSIVIERVRSSADGTPIFTDFEDDGKSDVEDMKFVRPSSPAIKRPKYICSEPGCSAKFENNLTYLLHQKRHARSKRTCPKCRLEFHTVLKREIHEQVHRGIPELQCTICWRMLSTAQELYQHRIDHRKTEHLCDVCGAKFKEKAHLITHRYTHYKEDMPYSCDICTKKFPTRKDLNRHTMYRHDSIKPFACQLCDNTYVTNGALKVHIAQFHEKQTPKTLHVCQLCDGRTFDRPSALQKHMLAAHKSMNQTELDLWKGMIIRDNDPEEENQTMEDDVGDHEVGSQDDTQKQIEDDLAEFLNLVTS